MRQPLAGVDEGSFSALGCSLSALVKSPLYAVNEMVEMIERERHDHGLAVWSDEFNTQDLAVVGGQHFKGGDEMAFLLNKFGHCAVEPCASG